MNRSELESLVREYVRDYPLRHAVETRWETPLVAVADAADPLFPQLKDLVLPTHAVPSDFVSGAKSVIAWFVPFTEELVRNNVSGENSTREWDIAYLETNRLLTKLGEAICEAIRAAGFRAALPAPAYNAEILRSEWSQRSVAFIAGLGTFGVNNMLITDKGCCGRLGSIVTDMPLAPNKRPETEFCLFKSNGSCGECLNRCPNRAYTLSDGTVNYDRRKCFEQIQQNLAVYPDGEADVCGKCICGLPCSLSRP